MPRPAPQAFGLKHPAHDCPAQAIGRCRPPGPKLPPQAAWSVMIRFFLGGTETNQGVLQWRDARGLAKQRLCGCDLGSTPIFNSLPGRGTIACHWTALGIPFLIIVIGIMHGPAFRANGVAYESRWPPPGRVQSHPNRRSAFGIGRSFALPAYA